MIFICTFFQEVTDTSHVIFGKHWDDRERVGARLPPRTRQAVTIFGSMVWSNSEMYDGRYDTRYDDNKYKDNEVLGIFSMDDSASLEYNFINFISAKLEIISKLLSRISSEKMKLM